ncbi:sugar transferase [Oryzobacter terrae]|uniref:sugar transferase n=1 Tax=Oryzobacter terrae TaxID=1620385 RepID=UPI00366D302B
MSSASYRAAKRAIDLAVSAVGLVVVSPLVAVTAAAIRLDDGGPVFFRQQRAGIDGVPFPMLKFRTMSVSGEFAGEVDTTGWLEGVPDDFVFKTAATAEARVTRVGRLLRRTSLDELPQLVNVFLGDMSLVGPRPEILPIVRHYNADQARRLLVKPGLTGWAQVTGRSSHDHGQKMAADRWYVENAGLRLDLRIIARTVRVALHGKGSF